MKYKIPTGDWVCTPEERKNVNDVLDSGMISEGKYCNEFSEKWAKYIGTPYCTTLNSGSSALIVGLRALNYKLKKFMKVATTPFTYVATVNSIYLTGNTPVYVDIDRKTLGMSPESLKKTLDENPDIDAVLVVHIMGIPSRIDEIKEICDERGVFLLEDNCQAYGTKYKGKMLGSYGIWSACSFFIAHTIQVSEMGTLNTHDRDLFRIFDKLKSNGRTSSFDKEKEKYYKEDVEHNLKDLHPRYYHDMISGNYRAQEFSGAIACAQFEKIDDIIGKRNDNVKYLLDNLVPKYGDLLQFPIYDKDTSYLGFPMVITEKALTSGKIKNRKWIREEFEKRGIETRPMYGCLPLDMPSLQVEETLSIPEAEYVGRNAWYIGCFQYLKKEDLDYIIKVFDDVLGEK